MKILEAKELEEFLKEAFPWALIRTNDKRYAIPTLEWVHQFNKFFHEYKHARRLNYLAEAFDCENMARLYRDEAQMAHKVEGSSLSVAVAKRRGDSRHELNQITAWDHHLVSVVVEPQTESVINLTDEDLQDITVIEP